MGIHRGPVNSFGAEDLSRVTTPHTDALMIQATITNYMVARVFVDIDSSVNIIFKDVFNQMQVDMAKLHHSDTSLFGFTDHQVQPLGQIFLPFREGALSTDSGYYFFYSRCLPPTISFWSNRS